MSFRSPVYTNKVCGGGGPGFGTMIDGEDDIAVISQSRSVDPTVSFDNIALSLHLLVALDVGNKLVEIHLVGTSWGHEGWSTRNIARVHASDQFARPREK